MAILTREERREKRHLRVRQKIRGTPLRPRLCIFKSRRHLYAQVLDDMSSSQGSKSLLLLTTNTKEFKTTGRKSFRNKEYGKILGKMVGETLKEKGIERVVFDRSGYPYQGVLKAFVEAVREQGIKV